MSDTKTPGDKTLHVSSAKTLTLKRPVEQNTVRQSFSHGRSKSVVVETVKRRAPGAPPVKEAASPAPTTSAPRPPVNIAPVSPPRPPLAGGKPPVIVTKAPAPAPTPAPAPAVEPPAAAPEPAVPAPQAAAPAAQAAAPAPEAAAPAQNAAPAQPAAATPRSTPAPAPRSAPTTSRPASQPSARPNGGAGRSAAPAQARGPAERGAAKPTSRQTGVVLRTLTEQERDARLHALSDAKRREDHDRRLAEEAAARRAEREAREDQEREAAEARKREEDERRRQEDDRKRRAEDEARRRLGDNAPAGAGATARDGAAGTRRPPVLTSPGAVRPRPAGTPAEEESEQKRVIRRPGMPMKIIVPPKAPKAAPGGDRARRGRLTVTTATSGEDERTRSVASYRRRQQRMSGRGHQEEKEKLIREVVIPETITVQELANRMAERAVDVIKLLMRQGQMLKITDVIDSDTAQLIAEELGHTVKRVAESDVEEGLFDETAAEEGDISRPPVVTIMGHVDHGKTSLLDAIRKTEVVKGEAGGITQHIGAYQVTSPLGGKITFIDTPGHAAFTAMRARGAKVTDIVVLVVAADDGVMPQTVEAISHAKAAGVPLIVAINKIDKRDADPQRVRTELLQHNIQVESMGGDTLEFEVSALTGAGLDALLEGLQLQAEILELRSDPTRSAEGTVIEAKLDRGRGPVATVLVQRGTLNTGDIVVAGAEWGRVRALISDLGQSVKTAGPSVPVEILGFNGTPEAGDRMAVVESEARAREVSDYRARQKRERSAARAATARGSLADQMRDLKEGSGRKDFVLVVKGDVQGSVEAINSALEQIGNEEVQARIIHSGVGGITESDVTLAQASGAVLIGFNVRAHKEAREAADRAGVEIRYYNIIYNLVDDVKEAMSGLLAPTLREERLGEAEILEIFDVSKVGKVAGCRVTDGRVERGAHVRLIRDNVVIHEGKLSTLKRFKDDVNTVVGGQECGMAFENFQDMRARDVIECYHVHEVKRSL
jgi:translation initiation factor IF-2